MSTTQVLCSIGLWFIALMITMTILLKGDIDERSTFGKVLDIITFLLMAIPVVAFIAFLIMGALGLLG